MPARLSWISSTTADADLVPVEELVVEPREGLVGVLARRVFVADPVDDRLQHREPGGVAIGLGLVAPLEQRVDVGQELGLALCCHEHDRGLKAERARVGETVGSWFAPAPSGRRRGRSGTRERSAVRPPIHELSGTASSAGMLVRGADRGRFRRGAVGDGFSRGMSPASGPRRRPRRSDASARPIS